MLEREKKTENGKKRAIEAEVNSESLVRKSHISQLRSKLGGRERSSNTAEGCFTLLEACSLLDSQNPMALNIHFIFDINQWGGMRRADRSCLSDTFYQNLKLGAWQQSHVTKYLQGEELHSYPDSELND